MQIVELYVNNDAYVVETRKGVKDKLFKLYDLYEGGLVTNRTQSGSSCTNTSPYEVVLEIKSCN